MTKAMGPIQMLQCDPAVQPGDREFVLRRAYWLIEKQCMVIPGSNRFIAKQIKQAIPPLTNSQYVTRLEQHAERIASAMCHERERHKVWVDVRRQEAAKYESEVWV